MQLGRVSPILLLLVGSPLAGEDWPQWRGPRADGVSLEKNLPTEWGPEKNVVWKAVLPGVGTSTPIIWGDQVFLTAQVGEGPRAEPPGRRRGSTVRNGVVSSGDVDFVVQSFGRDDGRPRWEYRFDAEGPLPNTHEKHTLASPSVVTDGEMVYAWMGTGQFVALTMEGKLVWSRHIGKEYAPFNVRWGHGSSPTLYKDSVILLCDHVADAYLLALDKRTGKERWRAERGSGRSYTTPFIIPGDGGHELVINSSARIDVYDPATGKLIWHVGQPIRVPVSTPVLHDGVLYTSRGYRSGPYMAVKAGGQVDVTASNVLWRISTGAPYVSSLLYYDGLVYMATDVGVASCVDAATGEIVWKQRLGGNFSASPVAADGNIYLVNEDGEAFVIRAGRKFELIARNDLGERTLASPAISGGRIYLRTDQHLVAIGN